VEVVCGPVDAIFLYHTDDMIIGGANCMIEIQRQIIIDLANELHKHGMSLPPSVVFQFDNCGENKNKFMFAFMSLLVEHHIFDYIECNFLIVGHTHTSIDQYFGVLSTQIKNQKFIGSPIALWHLLDSAHGDEEKRPIVNRPITVIYDYKKAFLPYLNKILYFQVPHCFCFKRVLGKAIMKYKLFSSHASWLPKEPDIIAKTMQDLIRSRVSNIHLNQFIIIDNQDVLLNELGLSNDKITAAHIIRNPALKQQIDDVQEVTPSLIEIELNSISQQQQRYRISFLISY
jgi:hypothetical protein